MTAICNRLVHAVATVDFGVGPMEITADEDLETLREGDRVLVVFADCDLVFTVVGRDRGSIHLGAFLTPWEFTHWRLDFRKGRWSLATSDKRPISALQRFYGSAR